MELGEKIKKLRKEKNMTLEQVGEIVGVGKSTVRKWENGMIANMRRDKIAKLAEALDTSPAYLMGWIDSKELGRKIKQLRLARGEDIMTTANNLEISVDLLAEYEKAIREIPDGLLEKIAKYFNITVEQLLHDDSLATLNDNIFASNDPVSLEQHRMWFEQVGDVQWTKEEFEKLIAFAQFLKQQRKK